MHFICIENDLIVSICQYEPAVPASIRVERITDEEFRKIENKTHFFNVSTNSVVPIPAEKQTILNQETLNDTSLSFLNNSDWKILRHFREKALGLATSLTDDEYLDLERQRQNAADAIIKTN